MSLPVGADSISATNITEMDYTTAKLSGYAYSVVFEKGGMDGEAFVNIVFAAMISLNPTYEESRITNLYC